LSHEDVAQWIEKANRYTSCVERRRVEHTGADLIAFAHARIDHWMARTRDATPGGYPAAAALLRATYDLIDRLKVWEEERGLDGAALFRQVCADLDAAYGGLLPARGGDREPRARAGDRTTGAPAVEAAPSVEATLRASLRELRDQQAVKQSELVKDLAATRAALRAIETSTFWRATGWPRRVVGRLRANR
jgi:hypothetical protein